MYTINTNFKGFHYFFMKFCACILTELCTKIDYFGVDYFGGKKYLFF